MLSDGKIEMGHARALLGAESGRQLLLGYSLKESLNVRQTEELIRKDLNKKDDRTSPPKKIDLTSSDWRSIEPKAWTASKNY